jgi:uncharacterized protein YecE (DUF72 family)
VTHEEVLKDSEAELEFIDRMNLLHEKLGPMLLRFPKFDKHEIPDEFSRRLRFFLQCPNDLPTCLLVDLWSKLATDIV